LSVDEQQRKDEARTRVRQLDHSLPWITDSLQLVAKTM